MSGAENPISKVIPNREEVAQLMLRVLQTLSVVQTNLLSQIEPRSAEETRAAGDLLEQRLLALIDEVETFIRRGS